MRGLYDEALKEGYQASYFLQMLFERGGLATAKTLINSNMPSDGFTKLWELDRLDLSVEALVLDPEWRELFTSNERRCSQRRLEDYGYKVARA
jgi:hypothetical protein